MMASRLAEDKTELSANTIQLLVVRQAAQHR